MLPQRFICLLVLKLSELSALALELRERIQLKASKCLLGRTASASHFSAASWSRWAFFASCCSQWASCRDNRLNAYGGVRADFLRSLNLELHAIQLF